MVHALKSRNQALVQYLIDHGAELNRKDKAGKLSLAYHAVRTGNPSIVTQLLDNGAVVNEAEADQLLGAAIYTGSIEMVDLFVANGARIKPVHVFSALSRKHFELTSALLDSVGIPNLDDNTLDTLTQEAEQYGHGELADVSVLVLSSFEGRR